MKKKRTQKKVKGPDDVPALTEKEVSQMLNDSAKIYRNHLGVRRERGLPVTPGVVRNFLHNF